MNTVIRYLLMVIITSAIWIVPQYFKADLQALVSPFTVWLWKVAAMSIVVHTLSDNEELRDVSVATAIMCLLVFPLWGVSFIPLAPLLPAAAQYGTNDAIVGLLSLFIAMSICLAKTQRKTASQHWR